MAANIAAANQKAARQLAAAYKTLQAALVDHRQAYTNREVHLTHARVKRARARIKRLQDMADKERAHAS